MSTAQSFTPAAPQLKVVRPTAFTCTACQAPCETFPGSESSRCCGRLAIPHAEITDEALIQIATEHADYRVRRQAANALYQRGFRAGGEMVSAARAVAS